MDEKRRGGELRVVVDTNVWLSAWLNRHSVPGVIGVAALEAVFVAVWSRPLQEELFRNLTVKFGMPSDSAEEYLSGLQGKLETVDLRGQRRDITGGHPDNFVIATAVAARADYIVTGDKRHLLPLERVNGTEIVTPRQFIGVLKGKAGR